MVQRESLTLRSVSRPSDIERLYGILDELWKRVGPQRLAQCHGRMNWPTRGVYFFFEPGEVRTTSGPGLRVVRVGTHALTATSTTTLWNRLSQHRGVAKSGRGNHRGSVFRLLVGEALSRRGGLQLPTWGKGSSPSEAARMLGMSRDSVQDAEADVEAAVSAAIAAMPFVWVRVDDQPGATSQRAVIERNAIALLSNYGREAVDPPSPGWLGRSSGRERVRASGLWNNNHVEEACAPSFLNVLAAAAASTQPL
jgi:hypothetical protein